MSAGGRHPLTLVLTARQAEALRALAALEDLPPEVYAAEVLVKHLYHAYTPEVAGRAARLPDAPSPRAAGPGEH
ncbi:MAG TPA: hypothetical protein VHG51_06655 [Longimicrobiaceae bacterium]|nr:hypothetical protein [Longimicrobiaceae bacterium]